MAPSPGLLFPALRSSTPDSCRHRTRRTAYLPSDTPNLRLKGNRPITAADNRDSRSMLDRCNGVRVARSFLPFLNGDRAGDYHTPGL